MLLFPQYDQFLANVNRKVTIHREGGSARIKYRDLLINKDTKQSSINPLTLDFKKKMLTEMLKTLWTISAIDHQSIEIV